MFPHVKAYDRHTLDIDNTVHERVVLVVGLSDKHAAIGADAEPDPSRDDSADGSLGEGLLEARKVSEVLGNGVGQRTKGLVICVVNSASKLAEQERMVVDTSEGQSLSWLIEAGGLHVFRELSLVELLILLKAQCESCMSVSQKVILLIKRRVLYLPGQLSLTL